MKLYLYSNRLAVWLGWDPCPWPPLSTPSASSAKSSAGLPMADDHLSGYGLAVVSPFVGCVTLAGAGASTALWMPRTSLSAAADSLGATAEMVER